MDKDDALLTARAFMLEHGEDPESDFDEPVVVMCLRVNAEERGRGHGQDAEVLRELGKQENRTTWWVDFWDNLNWLPPGATGIQDPIEVWVDDLTGEAWWVEDGRPSQTSWRE